MHQSRIAVRRLKTRTFHYHLSHHRAFTPPSIRRAAVVRLLLAAFAVAVSTVSCWYLDNPVDPRAGSYEGAQALRQVPTRDLISFSFHPEENPVLSRSYRAAISDERVTVTLPSSVDAASLIPRFTTNGSYVSVRGERQVGGESVQDFTEPLEYTVHAANGATRIYLVTVALQN